MRALHAPGFVLLLASGVLSAFRLPIFLVSGGLLSCVGRSFSLYFWFLAVWRPCFGSLPLRVILCIFFRLLASFSVFRGFCAIFNVFCAFFRAFFRGSFAFFRGFFAFFRGASGPVLAQISSVLGPAQGPQILKTVSSIPPGLRLQHAKCISVPSIGRVWLVFGVPLRKITEKMRAPQNPRIAAPVANKR